MNLHELKEMVKEEYNKFMYEQEDDDKKDDAPKGDDKDKGDDKPKSKDDKDKGTPKKASTPKVKAGKDDIGIGGDEDPEKTLRDIFNMLKDFFEGDDKPAAKDDKPLDPDMPAMPDIPGLDLKEAFKKRKLSRKRKGVKRTVMVERFKKLANIIK